MLNALQTTGQTAFYIAYDDLTNLDVLNGLAAWLGVSSRLSAIDDTIKPQNPEPALSKGDKPRRSRASSGPESTVSTCTVPRVSSLGRGPAIGTYVAAPDTPLMYLPIRGGLEGPVTQWLADLDATESDKLITNQNRKQTRRWLQAHPGHRKFTRAAASIGAGAFGLLFLYSQHRTRCLPENP